MTDIRRLLKGYGLYATILGVAASWEEKYSMEKRDAGSIREAISRLQDFRAFLENHIRKIYEKNIFGELDKEGYLKEKM